jgi:uncharacterized lipoprotein YajG
MKKFIMSVGLVALLAGCATQSHTSTTTDANNTTTVSKDKSSQPDNSVLTVVGKGVDIIGDVVSAILPPLVPVIVNGVTHPAVNTNSVAPAN